jgi:hypothetical protein
MKKILSAIAVSAIIGLSGTAHAQVPGELIGINFGVDSGPQKYSGIGAIDLTQYATAIQPATVGGVYYWNQFGASEKVTYINSTNNNPQNLYFSNNTTLGTSGPQVAWSGNMNDGITGFPPSSPDFELMKGQVGVADDPITKKITTKGAIYFTNLSPGLYDLYVYSQSAKDSQITIGVNNAKTTNPASNPVTLTNSDATSFVRYTDANKGVGANYVVFKLNLESPIYTTTQLLSYEVLDGNNGGSNKVGINALQLYKTAAPEPASMTLLGVGGLIAAARRRFKKSAGKSAPTV